MAEYLERCSDFYLIMKADAEGKWEFAGKTPVEKEDLEIITRSEPITMGVRPGEHYMEAQITACVMLRDNAVRLAERLGADYVTMADTETEPMPKGENIKWEYSSEITRAITVFTYFKKKD